MAQTVYPITPVNVTHAVDGTWTDIDVSASIPADSTGVILYLVNNEGTNQDVGVRKNGSTDNRTSAFKDRVHLGAAIGVDANRVFEAYLEDASEMEVWVLAYTMAGVTFLTNGVDYTPNSDSNWDDVDCSANAPSATGLIFECEAASSNSVWGVRKNGSTDDRTNYTYYRNAFGVIIGCDESQICEIAHSSQYNRFFLVGYFTDGATFNTNATDVSLGSTGSWINLTALPDTSVMGFYEIPGVSSNRYGLRTEGSAWDTYDLWMPSAKHHWVFISCDDSYLVEGKIASTDTDFFLTGYATEAVAAGWGGKNDGVSVAKHDGVVVAMIDGV